MSKNKIIFIKPSNSSFIKIDECILKNNFNIVPILLAQNKSKLKYFIKIVNLVFFLFFKTRKSDIIISWFADYHSAVVVFLSKLFKNKTAIFCGGMDTICYPELGKGVYLKKFRAICAKYALKNTSLIILNHETLKYHKNYFYNQENPHIDGIDHYVKNLKTPTAVVYNGIDINKFNPSKTNIKQKNLLLTVGTMNSIGDFYNKGFDLFIEIARKRKDLEFILIYINSEFYEELDTKYKFSQIKNLNVIINPVSFETLYKYYSNAFMYIQASITEGMPNSLMESMLMKCIPVGSNVNGIPDIIGNNGVLIKERNIKSYEESINKALKINTNENIRNHIVENFSTKKREENLIKLIKDYLNS